MIMCFIGEICQESRPSSVLTTYMYDSCVKWCVCVPEFVSILSQRIYMSKHRMMHLDTLNFYESCFSKNNIFLSVIHQHLYFCFILHNLVILYMLALGTHSNRYRKQLEESL